MTETLRPTVGNVVAGIGGVGLIAGSVGPWVTVSVFAFSKDIAGTSLDGKFTLVAGLAVILTAVIAMTAVDWAGWLLVGLGLAAGGVALYDLIDLGGSAAWGIVLCLAASALIVVAGISEILEL